MICSFAPFFLYVVRTLTLHCSILSPPSPHLTVIRLPCFLRCTAASVSSAMQACVHAVNATMPQCTDENIPLSELTENIDNCNNLLTKVRAAVYSETRARAKEEEASKRVERLRNVRAEAAELVHHCLVRLKAAKAMALVDMEMFEDEDSVLMALEPAETATQEVER